MTDSDGTFNRLTEADGVRVLHEVFRGRGIATAENVPFEVCARTISIDGYDAEKKIGFEFITTAAGDRHEFDDEIVDELEARMGKKELFIFLADELDGLSEASLRLAAERFLTTITGK